MTLKVSDQVPPVGTKLVIDTDANEIPKNSVTGAAGSIFQIDVDNTDNGDNAAYLKIYDNPSPVVGTTAPSMIIKCPVNTRFSWVCPDGMPFNDLSFAAVIEPGTAGTTAPTNPVAVKLVTT
jgi:hypothetical protein